MNKALNIINNKIFRIVAVIAILFAFVFSLSKSISNSNKELVIVNNRLNRKNFQIYKQKDDKSGYELYNGSGFPEGQKLNTSLTVCVDTNNNTVENIFTYENGKFSVTSNKTVFCTLYFDIVNSLTRALALSNPLVQEYKGTGWVSGDASEKFFNNHIYYWYATTTSDANTIRNSWNVVYAGHCWQIIRTTENGGVKLLYNGEPETTIVDGETQYDCSDNRSKYHMGGVETTYSISGSKKYSDSYTAATSGSTTTFTLVNSDSSAVQTKTISSENASDVVGMYTCGGTSTTCTNRNLRKIVGINSGTTAIIYVSTYRDDIGYSVYDSNYNSPSSVGYMYSDLISVNTKDFITGYATINGGSTTTSTSAKSWYFSDSYLTGTNALSSCGSGSCYALSNPELGNTIMDPTNSGTLDYSKLIGKYTLKSTDPAAGTSGSNVPSIYYVVGHYQSTIYLMRLTGYNELSTYQRTYNISQTYENGALQNSTQIKNFATPSELQANSNAWQTTWPAVYSSYIGKYVCTDGTDTCVPWIISDISMLSDWNIFRYYDTSKTYKFSNSISYNSNTNKYTLDMTDANSATIYDFGSAASSIIGKAHYTCLERSGTNSYVFVNNQTECDAVAFVMRIIRDFSSKTEYYSYLLLTDGMYVSTDTSNEQVFKNSNNVLYKLLYNDNVNTISSVVKENVDKWYSANLLNTSYESLIDNEEIFCSDRSTSNNYGNWGLDAENINNDFLFIGLGYKSVNINNADVDVYNLSCPNKLDAYSKDLTTNGNGVLTYSIGLMSYPEMYNLGSVNDVRKTSGSTYWLGSPAKLGIQQVARVGSSGALTYQNNSTTNVISIRPAIALTSSAEFTRGDGSFTDPYVVE